MRRTVVARDCASRSLWAARSRRISSVSGGIPKLSDSAFKTSGVASRWPLSMRLSRETLMFALAASDDKLMRFARLRMFMDCPIMKGCPVVSTLYQTGSPPPRVSEMGTELIELRLDQEPENLDLISSLNRVFRPRRLTELCNKNRSVQRLQDVPLVPRCLLAPDLAFESQNQFANSVEPHCCSPQLILWANVHRPTFDFIAGHHYWISLN